jgi:hypothetical protein
MCSLPWRCNQIRNLPPSPRKPKHQTLHLRMIGTIAITAEGSTAITIILLLRNIRSNPDKRKRGNLAVPPFAIVLCRLGSALEARMFHGRRAPQERCVQLWCSSKPGGVMIPPELGELATSLLLLRFVKRKRRLGEHTISTDCVSGKMI